MVGNPYEVEFVTIDSIIDKLKARASNTPPGTWVEGYFFDDTKVKDNRQLNVQDLDKVSTRSSGGRESSRRSHLFLQQQGVRSWRASPRTRPIRRRHFDKDANGELNGRVTDLARERVRQGRQARRPSPPSRRAARPRWAGLHSKQFVQYGLTSVHHEAGDLFALQQVRAAGKLLHRVSYEAVGDMLEAMIKSGIETGLGDEWIRFGATFEHTVDGSFSERTMALSTPYPGINPPYKGNVTETQEELNAWVERVHRAGIQVNCHANGDVAIDMVLTAVERAQKLFPRADARPKITHCTLINADLVRRIKALGAVPALFTTYAYYNSDKFHFYGEDMMKHMMAYRTLLDAGIAARRLGLHPGAFAPLMGIQGMVTRKGWDGKCGAPISGSPWTKRCAINTINGAYTSFEEDIKGSITDGQAGGFRRAGRRPAYDRRQRRSRTSRSCRPSPAASRSIRPEDQPAIARKCRGAPVTGALPSTAGRTKLVDLSRIDCGRRIAPGITDIGQHSRGLRVGELPTESRHRRASRRCRRRDILCSVKKHPAQGCWIRRLHGRAILQRRDKVRDTGPVAGMACRAIVDIDRLSGLHRRIGRGDRLRVVCCGAGRSLR